MQRFLQVIFAVAGIFYLFVLVMVGVAWVNDPPQKEDNESK